MSAPQRWPWDLRPEPDPVWRLPRLSCWACGRKVLVVNDLPSELTSYIPHRRGCPDLIWQVLPLVMTGRWHSPEADEPGFYCPDPVTGQVRCVLQGGLTTAEENELHEYQELSWPLEPWMFDYLKHDQDKACPDCYWQLPGGGA